MAYVTKDGYEITTSPLAPRSLFDNGGGGGGGGDLPAGEEGQILEYQNGDWVAIDPPFADKTDITKEAALREEGDKQNKASIDEITKNVDTIKTELTEKITAVEDKADKNTSDITAEAEARAAADTTIDNKVDTEKQDRITADNELKELITEAGGDITAEAAARKAADDNLTEKITTVDKKVDQNTTDITIERTERENNVLNLNRRIDEEVETRQNADETIVNNFNRKIANEVETLQNADETIVNSFNRKIANEVETLQNADNALDGKIQQLSSDLDSVETSLESSIALEQKARTAADSALSESITSIDERLTEAETNISFETSRRESADNELQLKLTTEIGNRQSGDNELKELIDDIISLPSGGTAGQFLRVNDEGNPAWETLTDADTTAY